MKTSIILAVALTFFWVAGASALLAGNYDKALIDFNFGAICLMLGILSARVEDLENKR